jgi:conjugal transfer pilus assembly protein TraB
MAEKKSKPVVSVTEAAVRKKQNVILFIGLGFVLVVAIGIGALTTGSGSGGSKTGSGKAETKPLSIGPGSHDKDAFRSAFQADIEAMRKQVRDADARAREMAERIERMERDRSERNEPRAQRSPPPPITTASGTPVFSVNGAPPASTPPAAPAPTGAPTAPPETSRIAVVSMRPTAVGAGTPGMQKAGFGTPSSGPPRPEQPGDGRNPTERYLEDEPLPPNRAGGRNVQSYMPPGFARAVLLNGIDAPTGGNAQSDPMPVLMQLIDDANLPNQFRAGVRSCFVLGNGYGDLSSERARIRLDRMSCVAEDGGAIDVKVTGYVVGEDGSVGLRCTLVTKSGQVIANSLLSGVVAGFGYGLQASGQQQNTTVNGAVTTTTTNPWSAGLGQGIGQAFQDTSRYFQRLSEKLFPVLECNSGRVVDIVFSRGTTFDSKDVAKTERPQ